VKLSWMPSSAEAVDFFDKPVGTEVTVGQGQVTMTLKPWQILTLRLKR